MKKITLFLLAVLFTANMFAVDKLLIVGDGVDIGGYEFAGWNGDIAPLMYAEGNNVFTFTGWFPADAEFKFMQNNDWSGQYLNAAGTGYLDLINGGTLREGGDDTKFKMEIAGFYKITCDLNALTVTAESVIDGSGQPIRFQGYYMVGSATLGEWDLGKSIPLEYQGGSEYAVTTWLKAGTFKLTVAPQVASDEWNSRYFFFKDTSDDAKMKRNQGGDVQWSVTEAGLYTVTINIADNSISYEKKDFDKLYVVGDAVDGGWSTGNIPMMNMTSSNVFSYTGWFVADKEFKFLPERKLTSRGLQILNGAGATGYIGNGEETLNPNIEVNGDYKFMLDESANYKVTCDLNTMTITTEKIAYQHTQIKYAALYMVGTATPDNEFADVFPTKAVKLTSNDNNTYSATKVALTTGVFKLLTANDRGWSTTNLFRDANDAGKISTDGTDDRKWTISSAKNYDITADLANMTISIVENISTNTSNESIYSKPYLQVISQNKSVEIVLLSDYIAESIELINITGKTITTTNNVSNRIVLGNNLHSGIYLVKINIAGKSTVEKVLVK
ncbi:hypothetical protein MASR2M117_13460 [Paludibacter sp.]